MYLNLMHAVSRSS